MRSFLALLLLLGAAGCDLTGDPKPPTVGTFTIDGTLTQNTCGYGGFPAQNFYEKTAIVRGYPGNDATFEWKDVGSAASGSATGAGTYHFTSTKSVSSAGTDPATGQPLCTFAQTTQVTFTITPLPVAPEDGGTADASTDDAGVADGGNVGGTYTLVGTHTEDVVPSGTGCAAFLAANGGSFDALPCRVAYTITGTAPR